MLFLLCELQADQEMAEDGVGRTGSALRERSTSYASGEPEGCRRSVPHRTESSGWVSVEEYALFARFR